MSDPFLKIQESIKTTDTYSTGSLKLQYILTNLEGNQRQKCGLCPHVVQMSYELNLTGLGTSHTAALTACALPPHHTAGSPEH